jgi:DNA polymerase-3 subunit gamma/tau
VLLNAGHNASSLARQLARYLRNTLMSKVGGAETDLLQISGDERARAARTAMLFSEEELTRNLQIVLRTFDDLNYRQEQRFHLELGLLKLIHAQRLLPIEELLSGVASGAIAHAPAAAGSRATPSRTVASHTAAARIPAAAPAAPTISPFGQSDGWGSGSNLKQSAPVATMERPAPAPATEVASSPMRAVTPFPAAAAPVAGYAARLTEGALAKAPETADAPSVDAVRLAVTSALANNGHESASQLLGSGTWEQHGSNLRIEVPGVGKKMIGLTVNAAAEKIIRQELQRMGAPARFMVVPGEGMAQAVAVSSVPLAGSIQETALAHPLVQRAKEIFKAEVRSVVDLRKQ